MERQATEGSTASGGRGRAASGGRGRAASGGRGRAASGGRGCGRAASGGRGRGRANGGRGAGRGINWSDEELTIMLDVVEKILPLGLAMWETVELEFNAKVAEISGQPRTAESIR